MARRDEEFWEEPEDWSRRKHLVLSYYLEPAAPKLRQVSQDGRVIILDGFAGRGRYEDGSPGSPVLIGQLADKCRNWRNPLDLRIYNIEPSPVAYRELTQCTAAWVQQGVVTNLPGTFQERLPVVQQQAGTAPLFAFLDPFRPRHLLFDDFSPLLKRRSATELCVVLHTPAVQRMIQAAMPSARTAEDQKERLRILTDRILGSQRWRPLLQQRAVDDEQIVQYFADELQGRDPARRSFVCSKAIQPRYKVGLKYHIVFFTRHPDGVKLMNDAFCQETRTAFTEIGRPAQMSLGFEEAPPVEMPVQARLEVLFDVLLMLGKEQPGRVWRRSELVFEAMRHRFGEFTLSEHRQAIAQLVQRNTPPRIRALDGTHLSTGRWRTNEQTRMVIDG